jgi:peptidoglycan/xylan/chitin deacetylase (PgdA/CDA1 family)
MPTAFLMYHELTVPGRTPCETSPGYLRYAVDSGVFDTQLDWLSDGDFVGASVGAALANGLDAPRQVVLTFDDGCETDVETAAPLLAARGFGATFFVVAGWVGRRGFMSAGQVRRLADAGFEVGSHSCSHAFLSEVSDAELQRELADSKRMLEDITGSTVRHLSCPGGRWSRKVAVTARDIGYESVSTSRVAVNRAGDDTLSLARCALRRDTTMPSFHAYCRGERLMAAAMQERLLSGAKRALGTRLYGGLRNLALRQSSR